MTDSFDGLAWRMFNLNWIAVAAMGAALLSGATLMNFSIEPLAFGITCAIAVALLLTAYRCRFASADTADPKLVFSLGTIAQVILVTAIVGPLSYVAAALHAPLQDQAFLTMDRAISMDPLAIASFVNDHQWLGKCLMAGYGLIKWPLLGIPIILAMSMRLVRLQQFIAALCIALAVTIAVSALVQAVGTYYGLGLAAADFPSVPTVYDAQLRDLTALRAGTLRHLELYQLAGIVSFPSFHAVSAILYIWAVWPIRWIRGIFLMLNLLMLASTPVVGAHYMVDVIGGMVVAYGSIVAAVWLSETAGRRVPLSFVAPAVGFNE